MEYLRFAALAVASALLCLTLRAYGRQDFAVLAALACGALLIGWAVAELYGLLDFWEEFRDSCGLSGDALPLLIKALGLSLASEFGEKLCLDAGEASLASKVRFGGKIALLALCLPLLAQILQLLLSLLSFQ